MNSSTAAPPGDVPILVMDQLTKTFANGVRATSGLSLAMHAGEILMLLGPSGCGKTTVLRLLTGLETVDSGKIFLNGDDVTHWPPHRRGLCMLFQTPTLYPGKTVGGLLRMAGSDDARIDNLASALRIEGLLQRRVEELSGGERQRVALASALLQEPSVLLLDEPLAHVDAEHRVALRRAMRSLLRQQRVATLWVTHDVGEALAVGDRVAVLHGGRLMQVGTPAEVYDVPCHRFVGQFIGSPPMNLVRGRFTTTNGQANFLVDDWSLPVPAAVATMTDQSLDVGIRPTDVIAVLATGNSQSFHVEGIEPASEVRYLLCKRNALTIVAASISRYVRTGDSINVSWNWLKTHWFDARTGDRIASG